jgi:hypothetical protein
LLLKYETLFDGTLGDWNRPPVSIELKEGATPYHGRPYPIAQIHKARGGNDKNTKNIFSLCGFYHLGSLGIYFDKMDSNLKKYIDQKCSIGGANGNFTGFS